MTVTFKVTNGDIAINEATGRPLTIEAKDKLRQDVRENIESEAQLDGTGADLDGVIAFLGDVYSIRAEISQRIIESFEALKRVQDSVQRFDRQTKERISRVTQVLVTPIQNPSTGQFALTDFAFRVDVLSVAGGGESVSVTGVLSR